LFQATKSKMGESPPRKEIATTSSEDTLVDVVSIVSLPSTGAASSQISATVTKVADNDDDITNGIGNNSSSHTPSPATNKGENGKTKIPSSEAEADNHVPASKKNKAQKWKKRVSANKKKKKRAASASSTIAETETTTADDSAVDNNNDSNNDNDNDNDNNNDDDEQTFEFPIVYRIKLNDIDTGVGNNDGNNDGDDDGTARNPNCSYDGTKNWPKHPLAIEVQYPKNYPWDDNDDGDNYNDNDNDNEQEERDAIASSTTDPSFRLLHDNSVVEFPSSVSERLLAVLAETAENERGMPCVMSCLYAALDYLGRDREWRDGSNNNQRIKSDGLDGCFTQDCAISDNTKSSTATTTTMATTTTHYACISTHHLLDHKPDNLLRTGHKFQLVGFYKFGTPGIAIAWGDKDGIEEFLDTLKRAMPQKKFELVFSRVWEGDGDDDDDNTTTTITDDKNNSKNKPIPKGWESADPPTLKQELDKIGVPEEDYYTALGLEKRDPPRGKGKTKNK